MLKITLFCMDRYQLKQTVLSESPVKLQSQFLVYFSFYCMDISSKKPLKKPFVILQITAEVHVEF